MIHLGVPNVVSGTFYSRYSRNVELKYGVDQLRPLNSISNNRMMNFLKK